MSASSNRCSEQAGRERKADIELSLAALGPIVMGLILESHFEPEILSEKAVRRILGRIFDSLFPAAQ